MERGPCVVGGGFAQAGLALGPLQRLLQRVANRVRRTRQSDETHVAIRHLILNCQHSLGPYWDPKPPDFGLTERIYYVPLNV